MEETMAMYDDPMAAAMAKAEMYATANAPEPETAPMKEQIVTTREIAAEHQRLNQRYRQLVNNYGQYVEMFEQWLAQRA
jgi:hypothetical protein